MAEPIASVKGMNDLLPTEAAAWQHVEKTAREIFAAFGYGEIRTPILEHTDLFARGIGEATDVVGKEMYTFADRAGRSVTMRPEMTAGVARAYIEHNFTHKEPVTRLWYLGQMFRYERMQVGRYRQFWQIGCECFGIAEPTIDAEQIAMLHALFTKLGVTGLTACINNVGAGEDRERYRAALVAYFEPHRAELCADCQRRLDINPLRILDCKLERDRAIAANSPLITEFLSEATQAHFNGLQEALTALGVPFRKEPRLVRGLDYYTGTVFEIISESSALGSQTTVVGGGRYDGLVQMLGGPATPAFGFAFGVERAILAMGKTISPPVPQLFIATIGAQARKVAVSLAQRLRVEHGMFVELEHREVSVKAQFKRADKLGAQWVLTLGDDDIARGAANVKHMASRQPFAVDLSADDVAAGIVERLQTVPDASSGFQQP